MAVVVVLIMEFSPNSDIGICFEDLVTHFPLSSQTFWTFASVVRAAAVLHSRSASPEC